MLDLEQELGAIIDALAAERIEYALCGGMAMAVHGVVQATVDVDLLVRSEDLDRIRAAVAHEASNVATLILDAVPVTSALEPVWAGREQRRWADRVLQVVSRDALRDLNTSLDIGRRTAGALVDYSDRAITERIRQVSQLRKLCLSLAKAKPVAPPAERKT